MISRCLPRDRWNQCLLQSGSNNAIRHVTDYSRPFSFALILLLAFCHCPNPAASSDAEDHFESRVRPLLIERCHKCHGSTIKKGSLRLDSRAAVLAGGDAGSAVVPGKPDESLLLQAVRHQNGLAMPPDGKLTELQITALASWIKDGAVWPGAATEPTPDPRETSPVSPPTAPNDGSLAVSLQVWLRADQFNLADGEPVIVWPDQSGHGHDVSVTKGIRRGGVGLPGKYVHRSTLMGRPAVHFETTTGLASSPDHRVDIRGDAALTIVLVINLQPHEAQPPYDGVLGIGNPAHPGDPGKPLAALVQINRGEDHSLHFAGGWNHDASSGQGSFKPLYGKPIILTVIKSPGPIRTTTRLFVNGVAFPKNGQLEGRDGIPDIQHRTDIGVYLGKALDWCGSIQGDVGEIIVYNSALSEGQRTSLEDHLAGKFGLWINPQQNLAAPPVFSDKERAYWAYQPIQDPAPPSVRDPSWVKTPVDQFVLNELEQREIPPAAPANKITLLRRITLDLTGLPPSPEEITNFLNDESPEAYERVVNRLLNSPHYGERWGRHWLDVVRFAESTANDANAVMRFAWRYRNYVIEAFNHDLPYDQFLVEQLAGDLLPRTDSVAINTRRIIATGYLMVGPKALAETDKEQSRLDIVDDQIDVTGRAILGLTVACARCHDHKFDAIRTTDYYALAGIFRSTEPFQDETRNASMWWEFPVPQQEGVEPLTVMAPKESQPRNLRIHLRGNRFTLGKIVPRGVLQVVQVNTDPEKPSPVDPNQMASGRLELARWIASPTNPLTTRVMVNRIWQLHFGRGLVATSDNFGTRGQPPSHPRLLDWLATRFIESGWSIKSMHRLMVLSNTYQQGITPGEAALKADPDRTWLSSFSRRRLSAEELRDGVLAISGNLDRVPGTNESGEYLNEKAEGIGARIRPNRVAVDDPFYTSFRKRTVYLPVVRNMLPDMLALFDAADPNSVTAVRNETTVASQSLFLLNSPFVREQAQTFATRLLADGSLSDEQRIIHAFSLALGRPATSEDLIDITEFLAAYQRTKTVEPNVDRRIAAWQSFCQSLLCSNEFLYVE